MENLGDVLRNTHAGVAIVGASIIAEDLRTALLSRMRPISKRLERELFEGYGPLSSFASRIAMAFAFGVVSKDIRDDMDTIRKIRNTFAHSKKILNFTDPEIAACCRKLRTWDVKKTNLQAVYMESLQMIDDYLEAIAREAQPGKAEQRPS
jgi:DNA-binding MltR family transcriptional regulator